MNGDTGIKDGIGPHDPADGARGPYHGQCACRIRSDLHRSGRNPAHQIEKDEPPRSQRILHIVSEDGQKPHVADKVEPPAVHEHGTDHGPYGSVCRQNAGQALPQRDPCPRFQCAEKLPRDEPVPANRSGQGKIGSQPLNEDPCRGVETDNEEGHDRRAEGRVIITKGKHIAPDDLSVMVRLYHTLQRRASCCLNNYMKNCL